MYMMLIYKCQGAIRLPRRRCSEFQRVLADAQQMLRDRGVATEIVVVGSATNTCSAPEHFASWKEVKDLLFRWLMGNL